MIYITEKRQILMEIKEILKYVDHTLLKQESTWEQMKVICDDAIKFSTASVCSSLDNIISFLVFISFS